MSNLNEQISEILQRFTLSKVIVAVITLVICTLINKILIRLLDRLLKKSKLNERVRKLLGRGVKILLYTLAGLLVLSELGFNTTSMVALVSVFSLGITLATEDLLGNVAGGLVLATVRCFNEGDFIKVGDLEGTVKDMRLSHTFVQTVDGYKVTVPNKGLITSNVVNYTALGRVRLTLDIAASYRDDPKKVCAALRSMLDEYSAVLKDPAPMVFVDSYGESSINYKIFCWTAFADRYKTKIDMNLRIWDIFAENGFHMDFNHLNVHMIRDDA